MNVQFLEGSSLSRSEINCLKPIRSFQIWVTVFNCYIRILEKGGFSPIIVEQKAIFTDHDISRAKAINLLSGEIRFAASYFVSTCEFGRYLFCFVAAVPIFYTVKEVVTIPN